MLPIKCLEIEKNIKLLKICEYVDNMVGAYNSNFIERLQNVECVVDNTQCG